MVNPKGISPLSFTSLTTSFAHNTRPIPAEAHQPVAEHLVKTALPPKQQSSSSINNNNNNNNNNHGNSKPITTITIITITTIITTITMESPLRPQLGLRIIITVRGRSQTMFTRGGEVVKNLTFCKLLYHRKCKWRGVGGQKKPNLVNVICERPLTAYTTTILYRFNDFLTVCNFKELGRTCCDMLKHIRTA